MITENTLIYDLTNEDYHAEKEHFSSSAFKLLTSDIDKFVEYYINKVEKEKKYKASFDEGSYLHSLILEPELATSEYAFFPGNRRAGAAWEAFKAEYESTKTILTTTQRLLVQEWYEHYKKNPTAVKLIQGCKNEVSLFTEIGTVPLKVRADALNTEAGYIIDVKTSSFGLSCENFKGTIDKFGYDLSAAMYLACFEKFLNKSLDFYFIVLGKKELGCKVFKLSPETRAEGREKFLRALANYKNKIWLTRQDISAKLEKEKHLIELV